MWLRRYSNRWEGAAGHDRSREEHPSKALVRLLQRLVTLILTKNVLISTRERANRRATG